jgi:hypothetical protein
MTPRRLGSWIVLSLAMAAGCGGPEGSVETADSALTGDCESAALWGDWDGDGIDDGREQCVLDQNAPLIHLSTKEDRQPTNVDWYLARSTLRFHHNNCSDCSVVGSNVQQWQLAEGGHNKKKGVFSGCGHKNDPVWITQDAFDENHHYFLQLPNSGDHNGSSNPAEWVVYGHVYPNNIGGVNAQYWLFYAYSDAFTVDNHQGDWEMVTVQRNSIGGVESVIICAHAECPTYAWWQVQWAGRHPHIWVADGTHASFPDEATCDSAERHWYGDWIDSCDTIFGYEWYTWAGGRGNNPGRQGWGVRNIGEKGAPLNNQLFTLGNVLWGEKGSRFSGPTVPTFKGNWNVNHR